MTAVLDDAPTRIREVITRLQSPIPDLTTLLSLLCGPLDSLELLPPQHRKYNNNPIPKGTLNLTKHILPLQRALLEYVFPTWESTLIEEKKLMLLTQFFCPDSFSFTSAAAGDIAVLAYSSILSLPLKDHSIHLLAQLSTAYPVDRLHTAVFSSQALNLSQTQSVIWEDCLRNVIAAPGKVANATGTNANIPPELEPKTYFDNVSLRSEILIFTLSVAPNRDKISSLTYLLTKLVNVGIFPSSSTVFTTQSCFWKSTLPIIRRRLKSEDHDLYSTFFSDIIQAIPSALTQQTILGSLVASLKTLPSSLDASPCQRGVVKQEANLLRKIVGPLNSKSQELWENTSAVFLNREWDEGRGRYLVCWAAGAGADTVDTAALQVLLSKIVDIWSSPEHIKHSLLLQHQYLTSLLLITISYFPPSSPQVTSLALSPAFISGIGNYISHLDHSIRRCGMLAAEIIAQRVDKKLNFGDWDGEDMGKPWARKIRLLIAARDVDGDMCIEDNAEEEHTHLIDEVVDETEEISTEDALHHTKNRMAAKLKTVSLNVKAGYDSDDSLTGYTSPSSSRSVSPTPSELEEFEQDPTVRVGIKKIPRPVYLAQLGELVRSTSGVKSSDDNQEVDKIEMALSCGEELIRKKRDYGVELDENVVNLVYGFVGLQDNFDLTDFDIKRQRILNALVACCPRLAAPSIIEEFFKNQYSTEQRYAMLNALALGARELASLPLPPSSTQPPNKSNISFPSKQLPGGLHQKYLAASNQTTGFVRHLLDGISREASDRGKEASADKVPNLVRERHLRIQKPTNISEVRPENTVGQAVRTGQMPQTRTTFTEVAAEYFIAPLINRFWLFLRNEQAREARTAHQEPLHRYKGAGTGLILNPVVLTHFLATLAVLVHAAQNATQWLAVVAPDTLELAVTLGTRPISAMVDTDDDDDTSSVPANGGVAKEAAVLVTALELVLVVLDGCLELDGGRSLGLDNTALLLGAGEWAGEVFSQLEKGVRIEGGGGAQEVKLKRAAAGVLLKVDELTSKWRRSMVDVK